MGMNGNSTDTTMSKAQGYKYRGRGFVQVTGKSNYTDAKNTCWNKFQLQYDFENNPELMANDTIAVWASFAWFVKNVAIKDLDTQNPDVITYKVNSAGQEKEARRKDYNAIRQKYFNCNK
jgi:putative chitinase